VEEDEDDDEQEEGEWEDNDDEEVEWEGNDDEGAPGGLSGDSAVSSTEGGSKRQRRGFNSEDADEDERGEEGTGAPLLDAVMSAMPFTLALLVPGAAAGVGTGSSEAGGILAATVVELSGQLRAFLPLLLRWRDLFGDDCCALACLLGTDGAGELLGNRTSSKDCARRADVLSSRCEAAARRLQLLVERVERALDTSARCF
jgi:hypothetical protein